MAVLLMTPQLLNAIASYMWCISAHQLPIRDTASPCELTLSKHIGTVIQSDVSHRLGI